MSAEVLRFPDGARTGIGQRLPAARLLAAARKAKLTSVTLIGVTEDGEDYIASTYENPADAVWDLEHGKLRLLRPTE